MKKKSARTIVVARFTSELGQLQFDEEEEWDSCQLSGKKTKAQAPSTLIWLINQNYATSVSCECTVRLRLELSMSEFNMEMKVTH